VRIGSLFSGIGGLELGLERAGLGPVIWQAESDPFCRRVLAKHWPNTRRFEDVRSVDENSPPVDLICGGFPCQDLSYAGNGAGLEGARSGLWFEYLRIVRALRPRFVVVENVPALLSRGLGVVLGGLAEGGYDAAWDCIPAQAVGAPHRRDRVFVIASTEGNTASSRRQRPEKRGKLSKETVEVHSAGGSCVADTDRGRPQAQRGGGLLDSERQARGNDAHRCDVPHAWPAAPDDMHAWGRVPMEAQPAVCRVTHGVSAGVDRARLRALGNAVVPQVAEVIGRAIVEAAA
jgi:DNA (cytosine-5)-methyltransferase 1